VTLAWRHYLASMPHFVPQRTYYATDTRIDGILYGCILALAANPLGGSGGSSRLSPLGDSARMRTIEWGILIGAGLLLLSTLAFRNATFRETLRYSLQGLALIPLFYLAIRYAHQAPFTFLNLPLITRIGTYSYVIYLCHYVIIKLIQAHAPSLASLRPLAFVTALLAACLYAALIDAWIDPYFRALRRHFRSGRSGS
jgi:peptidoglycan/LPS O-acetylase OafA/YrhL